jgi:alanine-alpha-ketoisovalerate/valine-pyruvate aminotransferase
MRAMNVILHWFWLEDLPIDEQEFEDYKASI